MCDLPINLCNYLQPKTVLVNEKPFSFPRVLPECTVPPISTAVTASETYYFSKCFKIDLGRHIVTTQSLSKAAVAGSKRFDLFLGVEQPRSCG